MVSLRPHDGGIALLQLTGTYREIGFQHGQGLRTRILAFLDDRLCRINAMIAQPTTLDELSACLAQYSAIILSHLPNMHAELQGLAEGAGISFEQALLLQTRREISNYTPVSSNGDCTTFAVGEGSHTMLAQTIDLNGGMRDELSVLHICRTEGERKHRSILVSFTGLMGYMGMNDSGLAIGLNLVLGGQWGPGIPGYMAIRHLLDSAASVDEALRILASLPLASSRSLTLCDSKRKVTVEYIRGEMHCLEADTLVHANHFLHAEFQGRDELNPLAAIFSRQRQAACEAELAALGTSPSVAECLRILAQPPICVAASDNVRREETVASVVMQPGNGTLWVRKAGCEVAQVVSMDLSDERTEQFALHDI
ncbi:isopenicillin-N N-acyltransferase-like protein [Oxalobacteraceae bacterium GrIS 1.11]